MRPSPSAIAAAVIALSALGCAPQPAPVAEPPEPVSTVLTAEAQAAMTPQQALADLKEGNERFAAGRLTPRDYLAQARATADGGQHPKAAILSCLDSRVPPELIFDQGIGDVFVGRVAGNVEDVHMVGSFEFAARAAGAKVIVVLGHSSCGAIKGAADGVELGKLTELLSSFDAPIARAAAATEGEPRSSNTEFLDRAIEENVRQTIADILEQSAVISGMVGAGELLVVGAVYDLASGRVSWLDS